MQRLGQTKSIYLKTRKVITGDFSLLQRKTLNLPARPCEEDHSFSFTACMFAFVESRVGCHLDWVGSSRQTAYGFSFIEQTS